MGKPRNKKFKENGTQISKSDIRKHMNRSERREARQFLKEKINDVNNLSEFDKLEKSRKFLDQDIKLLDWE